MNRKANAVWTGDLKEGNGVVSTGSGAISSQSYSFRTRFEDAPGTNPEELIAAAHASCYAMALSFMLTSNGFASEHVAAHADLTMENIEDQGGWTITKIHLTVEAKVPGITDEVFQEWANKAKAGCPISRVLKAEISLEAKLV